mgnify:FL=1
MTSTNGRSTLSITALPPVTPPILPVPAIPELFTGFRAMFAQEEQRAAIAATASQRLQVEQQDVIKATQEEASIAAAMAAGGYNDLGVLLRNIGARRRDGEVNPRSLATLDARFKALSAGLVTAATEHHSAVWRLLLMSSLNQMIQVDEVKTLDDIAKLDITYTMTDDDKQFAQNLLTQLTPLAAQVVATTGSPQPRDITDQTILDLQHRRGQPELLLTLDPNQMTVASILDSIRVANTYKLQEGVSPADIRAYLQLTRPTARPELIEQQALARLETAQIRQEMRELSARTATIVADANKLNSGEIISEIARSNYLVAVSKPGLMLFEPFNYWNKHIVKPIAGNLVSLLPGEQEVERIYQQARQGGMGSWAAHRYAFEEWDTNGLLKFGIEVMADPSTYIGFGFVTKVVKPLPLIGGRLAALNEGYARTMEIPFEYARKVWVDHAPKMLDQVGAVWGKKAVDDFRQMLETRFSTPITRISTIQARETGTIAIQAALDNPLSPDVVTRTGLWLLGDRVVTPDDIDSIYTLTKGTKWTVTPELLSSVDNIIYHTKGIGITPFLQPSETVPLLLRALDLSDVPTNIKVIQDFLTATVNTSRTAALNTLTGDNAVQMALRVASRVSDNFITTRQALVQNARLQDGVVAGVLHNIEATTRLIFMDKIDKLVTVPLARSYLLFGLLGPVNIAETAMKMALSGINFLYRHDPYARNASVFTGIETHLPLEMLNPERFVMSGGLPEKSINNLFSSKRMTKLERQSMYDENENWVSRITAPRWGKFITGYDWFGAMGGALRAVYIERMYKKLLTQAQPDQIDTVTRITNALTPDLETYMSPKYAKAYRQEIADRLLTGMLTHVRRIPLDFTPGKVHAAEVSKILDNFPEMRADLEGQLLDWAESGELWAGGLDGIQKKFDDTLTPALFLKFLEGPRLFRERHREIADELIDMGVKSVDELNNRLVNLDNIVKAYGDVTDMSLQAMQAFALRITNSARKNTRYDEVWNGRIIPHLVQSAQDIIALVDNTKQLLGEPSIGLTTTQRLQYDSLLDEYLKSMELYFDARTKQRLAEQTFFVTHGKPGRGWTHQTWEDFYTARGQPWNVVSVLRGANFKELAQLKAALGGITPPMPPDASGRALTMLDVATALGGTVADLRSSMYVPEFMAMRGRAEFINHTRAMVEMGSGQTADSMGYTQDALGGVYANLINRLRTDPSIENRFAPMMQQIKTVRDAVIQLAIKRNTLVSEDGLKYLDQQLSRLEEVVQPPTGVVPPVSGISAADTTLLRGMVTSEWQVARTKALDGAMARFTLDFPDYNNVTAVGKIMKLIFPFWTYEVHRMWWIPREFLRHPGVYVGLGRYKDNTDQGYTHIPGTDLDIGWLRGSIFMNGMRRLYIKDYPEYYDNFGPVPMVLDAISKYGFWPGANYAIVQSLFGTKTGQTQLGEIVPPLAQSILDGLAALGPSTAVNRLLQNILPSNYRDILIQRKVSGAGYDGKALLAKKRMGGSFDAEEQRQWDYGVSHQAVFDFLSIQTSMLRLNPKQRIEAFKAANEIISNYYGVPAGFINDIHKHGMRVSDVFGPLPPKLSDALEVVEGLSQWTGTSRPLMPSELGEQLDIIDSFWTRVRQEKTKEKQELLQVEKQFASGQSTLKDWLAANIDSNRTMGKFIDQLHETPPYKDVPITIEAREKFAVKYKILQATQHPLRELQQLYYSEKLVDWTDPATGLVGPDFERLFSWREAVEQSLTDDEAVELIELNQNDDTYLQQLHYRTNRTFLRPYYNIYSIILTQYPADEQAKIKRYNRVDTIEKQALQEELTTVAPGGKLIADFQSKLRTAHLNLRTIDPELDAWLNVFNVVSSFQTPEAARRSAIILSEIKTSIIAANLP